MEQQKVFPTACFGFDKKVVLDYIYEQDTAAKAREAELTQRATQLEEQSAELQSSLEELSAQCELFKAQLYSEKESALTVKSSYDKLRSDADQLVQVARNKDKELQIQLELNKQLQNRNTELELRLADLTQELQDAAQQPQPAAQQGNPSVEAVLEEARVHPGARRRQGGGPHRGDRPPAGRAVPHPGGGRGDTLPVRGGDLPAGRGEGGAGRPPKGGGEQPFFSTGARSPGGRADQDQNPPLRPRQSRAPCCYHSKRSFAQVLGEGLLRCLSRWL